MATSSYYLSEELIFKILSFLPGISLHRFRLVCKSWRSIISDPQFIDTHLTNSHKKQASTLFLLKEDVDGVYIDTREESVRLQVPPLCHCMIRWVCSCNGLVCLADLFGNVIYLWNPSTNKLKRLPTPEKQHCEGLSLGFVFDSTSNDYKLLRIRISHYSIPGDDIIYDVLEVPEDYIIYVEAELYSSNTNHWKEIRVPKTVQNLMVNYPNSKCVHDLKTGVLYFEASHELLSFDLHNEVFGICQFPNSVQCERKSNVLDYEGSVAMIFECGDGSVLSLWTLDDVCAGKVSWTKKFNIEADLKIDWVFLYLGDGQFVAENYDVEFDGYIFYDYKKKDTKKFASPAPSPSARVTSVVKYTDSLVSLRGFEVQE